MDKIDSLKYPKFKSFVDGPPRLCNFLKSDIDIILILYSKYNSEGIGNNYYISLSSNISDYTPCSYEHYEIWIK